MYEYKARVARVIDGDTYDCIVDLGCNVQIYERIRLFNYDTPEIRTKNLAEKAHGKEATKFVRNLIEGKDVILKTHKDKKGKYGRYLAEVIVIEGTNKFNLGLKMKWLGLLKLESYPENK